MEAEDPLSQLRDIHLPGPVSFWPPALGWWILFALILLGLFLLYRRSIAAMIVRRRMGVVLRELDMAFQHFREQSIVPDRVNGAGLDYLAEVNSLLKRVAQVVYPGTGLGELTGKAWLQFLDSCDGTREFAGGAGAPLGDGVYRRTFDADVDALQVLARRWIENRYRERHPGLKQTGMNTGEETA